MKHFVLERQRSHTVCLTTVTQGEKQHGIQNLLFSDLLMSHSHVETNVLNEMSAASRLGRDFKILKYSDINSDSPTAQLSSQF